MLYLLSTLLHYCKVSDLAWDALMDIVFLCQHYTGEVLSVRGQLDQRATRLSLLSAPAFSRLSLEDQRRCYQILLGIEPPPTMSITPAPPFLGHERSISAPEVPSNGRPLTQDLPHRQAQRSPDLLSPPRSEKPNASRKRVSDSAVRPSELPAPLDSQTKIPSGLSAAPRDRDLRARYRPVSASHASNSGVSQPGQSPPLRTNATQQPQFITTQQNTVYQSQPTQNYSTTSMVSQDRARMPSSRVEPSRTFAIPQSTPISKLNGFDEAPRQVRNYTSPAELSASPVALSPRQQYLRSQAGPGGDHPLRQHPIGDVLSTTHTDPAQARTLEPQLSPRVELPTTLITEARATRYCVVNPDARRDPSPASDIMESPPSTLPAHSDAHPVSHPPLPLSPQRSGDAAKNAPPPPIGLDTVSQLGQFIAELSVENSTPVLKHCSRRQLHRLEHLQPSNQISEVYDNSSIQNSPASAYGLEAIPASPPKQYQDIPIRPLQPRIQSTPLNALPASLMPGRSAPHQKDPSSNDTPPSPTHAAFTNTNASRYTRYYASTPPSSKPNSPQPTPYKAYQPPPLSPPMPISPPPSVPLSSPLMSLSPPSIPISPPIPLTSPKSPRRTSFVGVKDVDGASGYFKHRRDKSNDSSASHDSGMLALEYQAELPSFGDGYGLARKLEV
jgi:hypothetical protein